MFLLKDGFKEFQFGLVHVFGSFIVADGIGDVIQLLEGDTGFESVLGLGQ